MQNTSRRNTCHLAESMRYLNGNQQSCFVSVTLQQLGLGLGEATLDLQTYRIW